MAAEEWDRSVNYQFSIDFHFVYISTGHISLSHIPQQADFVSDTRDVDDVAGDELAGLESLYAAVILTGHFGDLRLILFQRLDRTLRVPLLYTSSARVGEFHICLLYTSPSPRDRQKSRMPSSA